jgi:hypothetical protein
LPQETIQQKVTEIKIRQGQIKAQQVRLEKDSGQFVEQGLMVLDLVQDL